MKMKRFLSSGEAIGGHRARWRERRGLGISMDDEPTPITKERSSRLPDVLRPLFWDYNFAALTWEADRELIVARVLAAGGWDAVKWLRGQMDDAALRQWIERRRGRGLSPRQLRFWELILGLPRRRVNAWLAEKGNQVWNERARR